MTSISSLIEKKLTKAKKKNTPLVNNDDKEPFSKNHSTSGHAKGYNMDTSTLIEHLRKQLPSTFTSEKKEESGEIVLHIGEQSSLILTSNETLFLFSAPLGKIPPHAEKEVFFQWVGSANFLRQGTGNAYLSVNEEEGELHLCSSCEIHAPIEEIKNHIEILCNYADYWKNALINYK